MPIKKLSEEKINEIIRFINKHYTNSESPMRQREIAKVFGITESVISALVVKHDLQKKHNFAKRIVKKGVQEIIKKPKLKIPLSKEENERRKKRNKRKNVHRSTPFCSFNSSNSFLSFISFCSYSEMMVEGRPFGFFC